MQELVTQIWVRRTALWLDNEAIGVPHFCVFERHQPHAESRCLCFNFAVRCDVIWQYEHDKIADTSVSQGLVESDQRPKARGLYLERVEVKRWDRFEATAMNVHQSKIWSHPRPGAVIQPVKVGSNQHFSM